MNAMEMTSATVTSLAEIAGVIDEYHRYTRQALQTLGALAASADGRVAALVGELARDMLPHMLKEEQVLFPYVDQLERGTAPAPFFGTVKNPVRMMMMEHDRVLDLLAELRDAVGPGDGELHRRLIEFDAETREHIRLENDVYFPRAVALEEQAGNAAVSEVQGHVCGCGHH